MPTITLPDFAASELAIRREEVGELDSPEVRAVLLAYSCGALRFEKKDATAIRIGLCELSNVCDDLSREPGLSPDERTANRHASRGLATAMLKAAKFEG